MHVAGMVWDWEVDDIDDNEDDGKEWVPASPQMLNTGEREWEKAAAQAAHPRMLTKGLGTGGEQMSQARASELGNTIRASKRWTEVVTKVKRDMQPLQWR